MNLPESPGALPTTWPISRIEPQSEARLSLACALVSSTWARISSAWARICSAWARICSIPALVSTSLVTSDRICSFWIFASSASGKLLEVTLQFMSYTVHIREEEKRVLGFPHKLIKVQGRSLVPRVLTSVTNHLPFLSSWRKGQLVSPFFLSIDGKVDRESKTSLPVAALLSALGFQPHPHLLIE